MRNHPTNAGPLPLLALSMLLCGAAGCAPVRPADMSAASHRREAAIEDTRAAQHRARYEPGATSPVPGTPPVVVNGVGIEDDYNPTTWHLTRAQQESRHAQQHRDAAAALDRFEARECAGFSPSARAACPLIGPIGRVSDIEGGVRIELARASLVPRALAHMRCHHAYAQERGFPPDVDCLLYIKGIALRPSADGRAIEVVASERGTTAEIRRRSRVLVASP